MSENRKKTSSRTVSGILLIGLVNNRDESWLRQNCADESKLRLFSRVKDFTYSFYSLLKATDNPPVLICSDSMFLELQRSLPSRGLRRDVLVRRVLILRSQNDEPGFDQELKMSDLVLDSLSSPYNRKQFEALLDEISVRSADSSNSIKKESDENELIAASHVGFQRALREVRQLQNNNMDKYELFKVLARNARRICNAEIGMLLSPALGYIFVAEGEQVEKRTDLKKGVLENSTLPFNHILANRSSFFQAPYRLSQLSEYMEDLPRLKSFAAIPMQETIRSTAVLAVGNFSGSGMEQSTVQNLDLLAEIGTLALDNHQTHKQLEETKTDLGKAYEDLNETYQDLQNHVVIVDQLQSLGRRIHAAIDIRAILRELVEGAHHLLDCEFCLIAFREKSDQQYHFYTNNEICQFFLEMEGDSPINNLPFFKDPSALGESFLDNNPPEDLVRPMRPYHVEISNIMAVPLTQDNNALGFLAGFNKKNSGFSSTDRFLIRALAGTAITAIMNSSLVRSFKGLFQHSVKTLANAIEARDVYTRGHTDRVSAFTQELAHQLGWDSQALENAYIGTLLHDIGKIGIPDSILSKPDRLTDDEFTKMREHVLIGVKIVKDIPQLEPVSFFIRHHHERYDGRGYPDKLAGEDIPLAGRLVAVADSFDAMTSDRPYRKGMNLDQAVNELKRNSGTQFDPHVVELFLYLLESGALDKHLARPEEKTAQAD